MTGTAHGDDFDIAKAIFDQLKDLPSERQQRVIRWVGEGLGVPATNPAASGAHGTVPTTAAPALGAPSGGPVSDIKTFIAQKAPKSDQQFAAAVAYYYRFDAPPAQRRDTVNADLLQQAARLAGRKRPGSPGMTLNNAKKAGYLDGAARGEFAINSVGENLVAMTLPGGTEPPAGRKKTKNKKKKARPAARKRKKKQR